MLFKHIKANKDEHCKSALEHYRLFCFVFSRNIRRSSLQPKSMYVSEIHHKPVLGSMKMLPVIWNKQNGQIDKIWWKRLHIWINEWCAHHTHDANRHILYTSHLSIPVWSVLLGGASGEQLAVLLIYFSHQDQPPNFLSIKDVSHSFKTLYCMMILAQKNDNGHCLFSDKSIHYGQLVDHSCKMCL